MTYDFPGSPLFVSPQREGVGHKPLARELKPYDYVCKDDHMVRRSLSDFEALKIRYIGDYLQ